MKYGELVVVVVWLVSLVARNSFSRPAPSAPAEVRPPPPTGSSLGRRTCSGTTGATAAPRGAHGLLRCHQQGTRLAQHWGAGQRRRRLAARELQRCCQWWRCVQPRRLRCLQLRPLASSATAAQPARNNSISRAEERDNRHAERRMGERIRMDERESYDFLLGRC